MLSRSLYLMELQVKMIKFACFGEKSGKKHIFRSDSCQLIVVDLNHRDEPFNVYPGGSTKHRQIMFAQTITWKKLFPI